MYTCSELHPVRAEKGTNLWIFGHLTNGETGGDGGSKSTGKNMHVQKIYVSKIRHSRHAFLLKSLFFFLSLDPQICIDASQYSHKEQSLPQQRPTLLNDDITDRLDDGRDRRNDRNIR